MAMNRKYNKKGSSVVSVGEIPVYPQVDAGKFCI